MSGSDGPSYVGGGSGGGDCSSISLTKDLQGPDPAVVGTIAVSDRLAVRLVTGPPQLVAIDAPAGTAGSIVPTPRLIDCLSSGVVFEAEVTSLSGGFVQLHITAI